MIRGQGIFKTYKGELYETHALQDVSFHVTEGEFVAIMGESGSGKSTLLHIIGCMDRATEGSLYIDGVDTQKLKAKVLDKLRKEKINFVFQHFALMEEYSIYENLESPLIARNIRKGKRKEIILAAVEKLGIQELVDKYPTQISGGQRQRVAIARAMITDTPLILADEPTGALDEENTRNVMALFEEMHKAGKTIVLITHDKKVAQYADRILVLRDGRLQG